MIRSTEVAQRRLIEAFAAMRQTDRTALSDFAGGMTEVIQAMRRLNQPEVAVLYEAIRDLATAIEADHNTQEAAR